MVGVPGGGPIAVAAFRAVDGGEMGGVLPLDVLLDEMRRHWAAGEHDRAVALARIAAPYLHGKAPAVRPGGDLAGASDEELEKLGRGSGEVGKRDGGRGGGETAANENTEEPG